MSTSAAVNADIQWAIETISKHAQAYATLRAYYRGEQPLAFAGEKFREAFGKHFRAFSENNLPRIVATVKDRLIIDGFQSVGDGASAAVDAVLAEVWRRNRMRVRAKQSHQDALIEGDAFVIVWPDRNKQAVLYPNRAHMMAVAYHDEQPGYITQAAKMWRGADKRARLNLFYPDRTEKYASVQKQEAGAGTVRAEAFVPAVDDDEWPLTNPFGKVPVFHFANRASIGELGVSEFYEALPMTDALNKTNADTVVAEEFYAIRQRWATGIEDAEDFKGKLKPGGVWTVESDAVEFGEFNASDISQYVTVGDMWRKAIARVTRTPDHYLSGGTPPSGESLKMLEAPLLAKVVDAQDSWGMVWGDVMRFAAQVEGVEDPPEVETIWRDTTPRNEAESVEIATKKRSLGVSENQSLRELGYSADDIERMREERRTIDIIPDVAQ